MPLSPTPAEIALALIVLKSKPFDISVSEYIGRIVSAVVPGQHEEFFQENQHIDAIAFWKRAYEQSEEEKQVLQNRVCDLESKIQDIHVSSSPSKESASSKERPKQARKANTQMKRRKVEPVSDATTLSDTVELNAQYLPRDYDRFLRMFHMLRYRIQQKDYQSSSLSSTIKATCRISGELLRKLGLGGPGQTSLTVYPGTVRTFYRLMTIAWASLLEAVAKADNETGPDGENVGEMTYLFQRLLGQIHQVCLDEADRIVKSEKRRSRQPASTIPCTIYPQAMTRDKLEICRELSSTACSMLAALKVQSSAQCLVLEGVLCALLDHIGSSISLLVFANPDLTRKNELGVKPPCGLIDVAHLDNKSALAANKLAAPFIVSILRQAKSVLETLTDKHRMELLRQYDQSNSYEALSAKIMKRLQTTLLRGIYGDESLDFADALRRSQDPSETDLDELLRSIEQEPDSGQWFIGQIWEHLGWDVLATTLQ